MASTSARGLRGKGEVGGEGQENVFHVFESGVSAPLRNGVLILVF